MATSQLKLYNRALLILGERSLSSLTENNEHRRSLDTVWDSGAIRTEWLRAGLWNFAVRTTQQEYDSGLDPAFGYQHLFPKPSDWVRTAMVASDEYFQFPLTRYEDEAGYWASDLQTMFVSYISNDASYGLDYSLWPEHFTRWCEYDLAMKIAPRSVSLDDNKRADLKKDWQKALNMARSYDAMDEPARFPPSGSWSRSRGGIYRTNYDRGRP